MLFLDDDKKFGVWFDMKVNRKEFEVLWRKRVDYFSEDWLDENIWRLILKWLSVGEFWFEMSLLKVDNSKEIILLCEKGRLFYIDKIENFSKECWRSLMSKVYQDKLIWEVLKLVTC